MTFQCLVQPQLDSSGAVCREMRQCCSSGAKACACSTLNGSAYGKSSNFGSVSPCRCQCSTVSSGKLNTALHDHTASATGNSPPAAAICVGWPAAGVEMAVQQLDGLREGEWPHDGVCWPAPVRMHRNNKSRDPLNAVLGFHISGRSYW